MIAKPIGVLGLGALLVCIEGFSVVVAPAIVGHGEVTDGRCSGIHLIGETEHAGSVVELLVFERLDPLPEELHRPGAFASGR
jgi:hypothetical protein